MSATGLQVKNQLGSGRPVVKRTAAALPQTALGALFTVHGGGIVIVQLYGVVTTAIQATANNAKIVFDPTTGADVDLCAVADITGDAVGTILSITGTLATALQEGLAVVAQTTPIIVGTGNISLNTTASATGAVEWYLEYKRLDPRARVTAA